MTGTDQLTGNASFFDLLSLPLLVHAWCMLMRLILQALVKFIRHYNVTGTDQLTGNASFDLLSLPLLVHAWCMLM